MTDPVVVDAPALESVCGRIATIAAELATTDFGVEMTPPISTALADSAVGRLAAPQLLIGELQRITAAVHQWVSNVRHSGVVFSDTDNSSAGQFSIR